MEKIRAMNKCKRSQFLSKLATYSLAVLSFSLFLSNPLWFPSLYSSSKFFLLVSLPNVIGTLCFNPRYLFIVCIVIITVLIGESKMNSVTKSSPTTEIYEEYVERSRSLQRLHVLEEKKEVEQQVGLSSFEASESERVVVEEEQVEEDGRGEENEKEIIKDCDAEEENYNEEEDDVEEPGFEAEELRKRVEDFIAKINHQRRVEARMLVSCCA